MHNWQHLFTLDFAAEERQKTRPKDSVIDGVGIVAILQKPGGPEIVLQKQFRPPIDKVVIEVPAGLVDEKESAAQSAVRELKEETGYVGTVADSEDFGIGCILFNGRTMFGRKPKHAC